MSETKEAAPIAPEAVPESQPQVIVVDWFTAAITNARVEMTPDLWEAMVKQATDYLMAGGRLGWDRWSVLDPLSREAFKLAAGNLRIRRGLEDAP